jgi:hypothetical protein
VGVLEYVPDVSVVEGSFFMTSPGEASCGSRRLIPY